MKDCADRGGCCGRGCGYCALRAQNSYKRVLVIAWSNVFVVLNFEDLGHPQRKRGIYSRE